MSLPRGWARTTIGELSNLVTSGSRDWSSYYADYGALFIRTQDINRNCLAPQTEIARVRLPEHVEGKRTLISQDDLLITITGANVGKSAHVNVCLPEAYVSQSVALIRLIQPQMASFLQRQLISPARGSHQSLLEQRAYGVGRPVLSLGDVRDLPIGLPPLAEQRRIAAKLDVLIARVVRGRAELSRMSGFAQKLREAALTAAFTGDLTSGWHASLGEPKWATAPLVQIISEGPTNGWSPKSGPDATGALTLKLTATTRGKLRLDEAAVKRIYEVPLPTSKFWLREGDLLIQRANSIEYVGASAIFSGPDTKYIYPDLMMRIRITDPILTRFVWYYLNAPGTRRYFQEHATGTAGNMPKINGSTVRELRVPLPSEAERCEILNRLDAIFARADRLEFEAARVHALLNRLESAILAKAFRGELVPQNADDEPASVLLDRIRAQRASTPKAKQKPMGASRTTA